MVCWLGEAAVAQARQTFQDGGIACYSTPEEAVRAFAMLVTYRRNQAQLLEAPAPPPPPASRCADGKSVRELIGKILADGRDMLTEPEPEADAVLAAYRIPVVATRSVGLQPIDAASAAEAIGFPVALKMLLSDISHKSDVGSVALNLDNAAMVGDAAHAILAWVRRARPDARLDGFTVQAMVRHRHARKLIVGARIDSVFGPFIVFGQGGASVKVRADRAVALPPLNATLARALVQRTRVARLFEEGCGTPCVDQEALHAVLVAVSQLLADVSEIAELE